MALALTEKASTQVKKLLEDQNLHDVFLRLGVKGGGCSKRWPSRTRRS